VTATIPNLSYNSQPAPQNYFLKLSMNTSLID